MLILGIETSCDETSVAVVRDGRTVLSNVIASSKKAFAALAGVIPEEAARKQLECIVPVVRRALEEAKIHPKELDAIAVTKGPGLLGSLLVGTMAARVLSRIWDVPLMGVHHTLGHLSSTYLDDPDEPRFPVLTLSASGGHSDLWYRSSHVTGRLLGSTRDDAAGEAFDKGASLLGLPYPGGPSIAKAAETGSPTAFDFPSPLHDNPSCDFSFSGLKTALKYLLRDDQTALTRLPDVAASYQEAICRHLLDRVARAAKHSPDCVELHIVGGVSANTRLRQLAQEWSQTHGMRLRVPSTLAYCTDHAAMIASAGYFQLQEQGHFAFDPFITAASLPLSETVRAPVQ